MNDLRSYTVWDSSTRWFHWINVLCVFALIAVGLVIFNSKSLGVSTEGKILLKETHTLIGYVFTLNLLWRFIWAFLGGHYARWHSIRPWGKGFRQAVHDYVVAFISGRPVQYLGHNPLGRISVFVLFILLAIQAITGLVLAGTDIFYPPFGGWIAQWIAAPGLQPDTLVPYAPEMYDPAAYESMRAFRKPFVTIHEFNFFVLAFVICLHIVAVILTEIKEGGNLISAMFTGKKIVSQKPVDARDSEHGER